MKLHFRSIYVFSMALIRSLKISCVQNASISYCIFVSQSIANLFCCSPSSLFSCCISFCCTTSCLSKWFLPRQVAPPPLFHSAFFSLLVFHWFAPEVLVASLHSHSCIVLVFQPLSRICFSCCLVYVQNNHKHCGI